MTSSQLQTILSALPSDTPVYLYVEGREALTCLCGERLYACHENYYTLLQALPTRLYGVENGACVVLCADKAL